MVTFEDANATRDFFRNNLKDKLIVSDYGATVVKRGKELSKGCMACKTGSWICVYIGASCNLSCLYCPQSTFQQSQEGIWANGGAENIFTKEDLLEVIEKNPRITGISFSGGEPFLYLDKVKEWLIFINEHLSDLNLYTWIYTNGVLVSEENCLMLKEHGINEIRFDLAATNYSDAIIEKMKFCKRIFDKLSVEVPLEPQKTDKLISVLSKLDEIGLDYLNLHELRIFDTNKEKLIASGRVDPRLIYNPPAGEHYFPSVIDIYRVIRYIEDNNLNISYNDCSCLNKMLQGIGWAYQFYKQDPSYDEAWEDFLIRTKAEQERE